MIGPRNTRKWVGLVCDASSTTVFAASGTGADAALVARQQFDYESVAVSQSDRLESLKQFVADNHLKGCHVRIAFAGSGTIVQRLALPPLSVRNRLQAARTHLMNYADGRELQVNLARPPRASRHKSIRAVAVGIDLALGRAIHAACQHAGLRVKSMTARATAFRAAEGSGALVQLVLGERTTTIQLFEAARLIASRDILLGRRDFVQAFQRPILTDGGSITFTAEEADALFRQVGIPTNREGELRPGVSAEHLWPTLNPVLQKLVHEVAQSLAHSEWENPADSSISVLGLPAPPGLAAFLVSELRLRDAVESPQTSEATYLSAFAGHGKGGEALDLRPPEQQFAARMTKPALAAGFCALLIMLANATAPRQADAHLAELRPVGGQLIEQLERAENRRGEMQAAADQLADQLKRSEQLLRVAPAAIPTRGPLKVIFRSVPPDVELLEAQLSRGAETATLVVRAAYRGPVPASILAARWGRQLSESAFFNDAKVVSVSGSGQEDPAVIVIRAELDGG